MEQENMKHIHNEYYLTIKTGENLSFEKTQVDLEMLF